MKKAILIVLLVFGFVIIGCDNGNGNGNNGNGNNNNGDSTLVLEKSEWNDFNIYKGTFPAINEGEQWTFTIKGTSNKSFDYFAMLLFDENGGDWQNASNWSESEPNEPITAGVEFTRKFTLNIERSATNVILWLYASLDDHFVSNDPVIITLAEPLVIKKESVLVLKKVVDEWNDFNIYKGTFPAINEGEQWTFTIKGTSNESFNKLAMLLFDTGNVSWQGASNWAESDEPITAGVEFTRILTLNIERNATNVVFYLYASLDDHFVSNDPVIITLAEPLIIKKE